MQYTLFLNLREAELSITKTLNNLSLRARPVPGFFGKGRGNPVFHGIASSSRQSGTPRNDKSFIVFILVKTFL